MLLSTVESVSTVHVNSRDNLHYSDRTGFGPKPNALNWIRSSKKNIFLFLIVIYLNNECLILFNDTT